MRLLSLWLVLFLMPALASPPELQLNNLNFSYQAPSGTGSVDSITYRGATLSGDLQVHVSQPELNHYLFDFKGIQTTYVDSLGTFEKVIRGEMSGFFISHGNQQLETHFKQFSGLETQGYLMMSDFRLSCFQQFSLVEGEWTDILDSCFKKGSLNLGLLSSLSADEYTASNFAAQIASHLNQNLPATSKDIRKLKIRTDSNSLWFSLDIPVNLGSFKWSGNISGKGKIWRDPNKNELVIRISRVKAAGFIDITSQFFKAIRGVASGRLTVARPYIRIRLSSDE